MCDDDGGDPSAVGMIIVASIIIALFIWGMMFHV